LKRSSRLIILVGILLAVAAFAATIYITSQPTQTGGGGGGGGGTGTGPQTATVKVVVASTDIALGSAIEALQVSTKDVPATQAPAGSFTDPKQVIDRVVRRDIRASDVLIDSDFSGGLTASGDDVLRALKKGLRAIAIQVDQTTGVGTLIQPGDRVDVIIGFKIQEMVAPAAGAGAGALPQVFPGEPQLSVKNIIQNVEVLGRLLPVPTTAQGQQAQQGTAPGGATGLTDQHAIVVLAVTAQQAEVLKYAQVNSTDNEGATPGMNVELILRSPQDAESPPDKTSGIVLKTLVEQYGVLPPFPILAEPVK
jgi:Flp pilus assembly protein CpaB